MKEEYDFSDAKRGAVVPSDRNKKRITIYLDQEIIEHFKNIVLESGRGSYQTLINAALKEHIYGKNLEKIVRNAVFEAVNESKKVA
ncbi:MAG: BrnA antitoxin family protein [Mariprofundaceae bacterium]|nr:BrnA antitoxin family protein [Mariprofundaceae bacterium]